MLILTPPGYVLTSDGRFIHGGPRNVLLGPGMQLDSFGNIRETWPKFDPPLEQFPQMKPSPISPAKRGE